VVLLDTSNLVKALISLVSKPTFKGSAWVMNIFVKAALNSRTCANGFKFIDCRFKEKIYINFLLAFLKILTNSETASEFMSSFSSLI
jgi:hypothetical protein